MINAGPLLFGILVALFVLVLFGTAWRFLGGRDPMEMRLAELGSTGVATLEEEEQAGRRPTLPVVNRLLAGFGLGPRLAATLTRADLPLTAAEFTLIAFLAGMLGFALGTLRLNVLLGLVTGAVFAMMPFLYVRTMEQRRVGAFTEQLPEVLTLLVGALRAGYGLTQALEMMVEQLPNPASKEFARVMQAISLGLPVQRALSDMALRVGSDDLAMVVTAINVQYETGGNLAQTLEIIGETVRDRIRMLREIRVLTAQQRLTGYILAVLPVGMGIFMFFVRPEYLMQLFQPGWVLIMPIGAVILQVLGFLIIRRIVDIEV